ncbi:GNAT family N-acetyltransferase [Paenibacillus sp. IHBB 10380]|uniref:GNAT family N-acetyltransferase n=1 Tax=Paenibacillus sp. IHBB 10380 TaxID=1566358 RepID=UPI0005CFADB1|nr:GNAT family N-acetyltransferase [Paenibacillus sp. IHBB 10380]AJS60870.1 hypothetical protein UB51_23170 [Paenibacillus sp. IHBB 10380]
MEIRQLTVDEFEERMALSQFAFQNRLSPDDMENQRLEFRPDQEWGVFDEQGKLLSSLLLFPLEVWIQERKFAMGGIGGVATWPETRRQGCVSKLLEHSLETMRKNGQTVSMLHPFSIPFYRKFGWEMTVEVKKYTIKTGQLPHRVDVSGRVERMPKPDIDILDLVYTQYASRYTGTLIRTADWWEQKILYKPGIVAVYTTDTGKVEGYVFYEVANGKLTIHELVSINETARLALWTYIGNHDSMIDEVILMAPMDDSLPFLLPDPRIKQEVFSYFMSRIVDVEAFVSQYAWLPREREEEVIITLTDDHAPWNNGVFKLVWSKEGVARLDRVEMAKVDKESGEMEVCGITCDIQALTVMLLGTRKPSWLCEVGRMSGSKESVALLEQRIPIRMTHLMDFF